MSEIVIIGNSAAGLKALETLRKHDPHSRIILISKEEGPAYSRVLLPYFLRNKVTYENLFIRTWDYYRENAVSPLFNTKVEQVDHAKQLILLDNGKKLPYDKLLIASGAHPVKPPVENLDGPGVFHLWTLQDARDIEPCLVPGNRALVLGSGFVALQAAWAAQQRGLNVTVCELMERIMPKVLDRTGSEVFRRRVQSIGVEVRTGVLTEAIEYLPGGSIRVFQKGYPPFEVDLIIVGTGVRPNIDFLQDVPIRLEGGIAVNSRMESSISSIFAAGDVASGKTAFGESHITHALWPTAIEHGKIAGANLAGTDVEYRGSLNMNVTEMFGTTVASMGIFEERDDLDSFIPAGLPEETYLKVSVRNNRPVGAVLLGEQEQVKTLGALRSIIRGTARDLANFPWIGEMVNGAPYFHRFIA